MSAPNLLRLAVLLLVASVELRADDPLLGGADDRRVDFFETRIRPLLAEHCYECHNSTGNREGELALDWQRPLRAGGASGPVVVPGKPAESLLLKVVRHQIADLEMPSGGPKLDAKAVGDLERWIRDGAVDPRTEKPTEADLAAATSWEVKFARRKKWWSFEPVRDVESPEASDPSGPAHPVDRFVHARLDRSGLRPSPPAEPATLVRRYYFTLTGLPPTREEAVRWAKRLSVDDATERTAAIGELVDELLASPHFGERWARHWMDWIRYAESHGSEGDPEIVGAWRYRDYLIRALNADVPYDQLVREHVAGDLLAEPRIDEELGINESVVGTAHWRMVFHGFAPTDALDERVRFTDDQLNAFTKAFLGLTVSCARCHDHKFDAISQRDYYALFGVLRSSRPGRKTIDLESRTTVNAKELRRLKTRIRAALADAWSRSTEFLPQRVLAEGGLAANAKDSSHPLHDVYAVKKEIDGGNATFPVAWRKRLADWRSGRGAEAPDGAVARWDLSEVDDHAAWNRTGFGLPAAPAEAGHFSVATTGADVLDGIHPAGVYSHSLSTKHAARLTSPDVSLEGEYELWVRATGAGGASLRYAVHDYPRRGTVYPVQGLGPWRWHRFDLAYWKGERVHVELSTAADAPLLVKDQTRSWFGVREVIVQRKGAAPPRQPRELAGPLFALAEKRPPTSLESLAELHREALAGSIRRWRDGEATDGDALFLAAAVEHGLLPNRLDELQSVAPLVAEYRRLESAIPVPTRVPALEDVGGRVQHLFQRGDHRRPGEVVPAGFLSAIDATPYRENRSGRLQLADDLLDDRNPFVRRVIVNRLWHHAFGAGLVRTPDNLGRLGDTPSHPELLDWLATRFAEEGWSVKRCLKLLVTSRTWQATARPTEEARRLDPDNRLLSHFSLRRLEAEAIRDGLLATAGVLDRTRFGPPVAGNSNRRSVYVRVRRNSLDPFLRTFDFPEPFSSTGRRGATNVPAQPLLWMNDERVHALAASWARRVLSNDSLTTDADRVREMFLTALGREPTANETSRMLAHLNGTDEALARTVAQAEELRTRIADERSAAAAILDPVRERLLAERRRQAPADRPKAPRPVARWDFDGDARDTVGSLHATLHGGARVENGALVLDGRRAHALTGRLDRDLSEKTLEAWVRLDGLSQRGGGVVSVQTPNGSQFDAIVFGEQKPGEWLAGSDFFRRTKPFGGPVETEASRQTVHVAIVYAKDGTITAYREGKVHGKPYQSRTQSFRKGDAVVGFGVRHLPATGNRMLAGRIDRAQLHARALSANEIAASAGVPGVFVTHEEVLAALARPDRERHASQVATLADLEAELAALGPVDGALSRDRAWSDLALAILSLKEFVHLR